MKRVLIVGSGGAGKSTLARTLGAIHELPVIHLDSLYWQPGWIESSKEQWEETVARLVEGDAWVMDGNYRGTMDLRIAACDTVIFLALSRWVCLWSVLRRLMAYHGRSRPDMPERCPERLSWEFLCWIWNYPGRETPKVMAKLRDCAAGKQVIVLKSRREVVEFIATQRAKAASPLNAELPS